MLDGCLTRGGLAQYLAQIRAHLAEENTEARTGDVTLGAHVIWEQQS